MTPPAPNTLTERQKLLLRFPKIDINASIRLEDIGPLMSPARRLAAWQRADQVLKATRAGFVIEDTE